MARNVALLKKQAIAFHDAGAAGAGTDGTMNP
jgi:hypothetical protein